MNNRKVNKLLSDIRNITVYEIDGVQYIKVDDFVKCFEENMKG